MKTRLSNLMAGMLVNAYMAFTVIAILFEKRKKKKATHKISKSITRQPSISKA